ncbi:MAG: universal stress protein [Bacteroidia bacterium]|nr:universal stress protein [Bacteroidia bacterium]
MKKIFVPTDFSAPSLNAARYATDLAMFLDAKMVLFHSFQLPLVTGEVGFIQFPYEEISRDSLELLKKERFKLQKGKAMELAIDCVVKSGFAGNEIVEESKAQLADMIVMGITGRNKAGEIFIGSNSVYVARHSTIPVLIVPENVSFKKIKKIAFACDFDHTENSGLIENVKLYQFMFDAELDIVNVYEENKTPVLEKAISGLSVENSLQHTEHNMFFINNSNPSEGLEDYLEKNKPDLLITAPKKHNLIEKIFKENTTKKLAYHANIPLLTLNQIHKTV